MENRVLKDLEPQEVFKYFEELSQIPRGSGNEKAVSDYLVNFAKELNLEVSQDKAWNVIIRKPATTGYENATPVIIQGHMDMVCEKNKGTEHNFEKDPLKLRIDGDYVYATNTTLGADNGIAVAYAMAILASKDIAHPALEVLVTSEEETGMGGATALDKNDVVGRTLINIDSEEEGTLLVSCAGGIRTCVTLPICWIDGPNSNVVDCSVIVSGLRGGHSGMDINKERGNANKILGRVLMKLLNSVDLYIIDINGGAKANAIPREADATIKVYENSLSLINSKIEALNEILQNELKSSDQGVKIELKVLDKTTSKCFSKLSTEKAISLLCLMPNGIKSMSMDIPGLVQSSVNLGVVVTKKDEVEFDSAVRSSVGSLKDEIVNETVILSELLGARINAHSSYPEWQYDKDSKIRKVFEETYENLYGKKPEIAALHAGLECGLFKEKFGEIDMISFGPNLYDVHTPNEHMSISSVKNNWEYLVEVLKNLK